MPRSLLAAAPPPNASQYKSTHEAVDGGGGAAVPLGHVGANGQPCPLAGSPVGKNTK